MVDCGPTGLSFLSIGQEELGPRAPRGTRETMSPSRLLQRFLSSSLSNASAVTDSQGCASFAELAARARALARRIEQQGLGGQRIALLAPQDRSWLVGFWAVLLARGTVVPI